MTETYTITYLEMDARPDYGPLPAPAGAPLALIRAEDPPVWYFLSLYDAVGAGYLWTEWHDRSREEQEAFVKDPRVSIHTLIRNGWPAGFFMLDCRSEGHCELAYFGLVPEAVGHGLGGWLLRTAIQTGWDQPGVRRMGVNTCTLDHPNALPLYQKCGFVPVRREERSLNAPG